MTAYVSFSKLSPFANSAVEAYLDISFAKVAVCFGFLSVTYGQTSLRMPMNRHTTTHSKKKAIFFSPFAAKDARDRGEFRLKCSSLRCSMLESPILLKF